MNSFLNEIKERILVFDGSKGTMLQRLGLKGGECAELWNIERSEDVKNVLKMYRENGSDMVQTCTFQSVKLKEFGLQDRMYEINLAATKVAREAAGENGFVAADVGPVGRLFEPSGDLTFEEAYEIYKEQIKGFVDGGADAINFETFTDLAEMRAAIVAAKENCSLPLICSMSFESNGRSLMGNTPYVCALVMKSLGASIIGTNCSLGPEHLLKVIREMGKVGGIPLMVKPNAGLPQLVDGEAVYNESPEHFAKLGKEFVENGVVLMGGCCGTTPEFVKAIADSVKGMKPVMLMEEEGIDQIICSSSKALKVSVDQNIGMLDFAGDKELSEAAEKADEDYFVDKALEMAGEGFDAISMNLGTLEGEKAAEIVNIFQGYCREPLIFKGTSETLEQVFRIYKGRAGVMADGMDEETKKAAARYGAALISNID